MTETRKGTIKKTAEEGLRKHTVSTVPMTESWMIDLGDYSLNTVNAGIWVDLSNLKYYVNSAYDALLPRPEFCKLRVIAQDKTTKDLSTILNGYRRYMNFSYLGLMFDLKALNVKFSEVGGSCHITFPKGHGIDPTIEGTSTARQVKPFVEGTTPSSISVSVTVIDDNILEIVGQSQSITEGWYNNGWTKFVWASAHMVGVGGQNYTNYSVLILPEYDLPETMRFPNGSAVGWEYEDLIWNND